MNENESKSVPTPANNPQVNQDFAAPDSSALVPPNNDIASNSAQTVPPTKVKTNRWRRRFTVAAVVILLLMLVGRIAIPMVLPAVLRQVAGQYGLDCSYERVELSVFNGNFGLWGLKFWPKGDPDHPVLLSEYTYGNVSTWDLLHGRLMILRAEADGVDLQAVRQADGHVRYFDQLVGTDPNARPRQPRSLTNADGEILKPPLRIVGLLLNHLHAHWVDESIKPALQTEIMLDVRISDVDSPTSPMRLEVGVEANNVLDGLQLIATRQPDAKAFNADLDVSLRGLHLQPLIGYLRPLGIDPLAHEVSMRLGGKVRLACTQPSSAPAGGGPPPATVLAGTLDLRNIAITADQQPVATLDSLLAQIDRLDLHRLDAGKLTIRGVHVMAARGNNGKMRVAGVELTGEGTSPVVMPAPEPASPLAAHPFAIALHQLSMQDLDLVFTDSTLQPPADLRLAISDFSSSDIVLDPDHPDQPVKLALTFRMPELVESVHLEGSAHLFTDRKTAQLSVAADGVRPELLQPYLKRIGFQSTLQNGRIKANADCTFYHGHGGAMLVDAELKGVELSDGETPLFEWPTIKLGQLGFSTLKGRERVRAETVELVGPKFLAHVNEDGTFSGLGLTGRPAATAPSTQAVASAKTAPMPPLPRIEVGHLLWKEIQIHMEDQSVQPPTSLVLKNAGVEMRDVVLDLQQSEAEARASDRGTVRAWIEMPGVAQQLTLEGQLTPRAGAIAADLKLNGEGLSGSAILPYLRPLGIEPTLQNGSLTGRVTLTIARAGGETTASLVVKNLLYNEGATELAAIAELNVAGFATKPDLTVIDAVELKGAHLRAHRNADESLVLAGIRILPPIKLPEPTTQIAMTPMVEAPAAEAPSTTAPVGHPSTNQAISTRPVLGTVLHKLRMEHAQIAWSDDAVSPPVYTTVDASLSLDELTLGVDAPPARVDLQASVSNCIQSLHITGSVSAAPTAQSAILEINASGMQGGSLAQYLPPRVKVDLTDGTFSGHVEAAFTHNPAGGIGFDFALKDVDYREKDSKIALLKVDTLRVDAPRIDTEGNQITFKAITCTGVEADVSYHPDGTIKLLGMTISPSQPAAEDEGKPVAPPPPPETALTALQLAAQSRKVTPLVSIAKLDTQLLELTIHNLADPEAEPLVLSDFWTSIPHATEIFGPQPERRPPVELVIQGKVAPLAEWMKADLIASPLAYQPAASLDVQIKGLHGDALPRMVSYLRNHLATPEINDGALTAHMEAQFRLNRRSAQPLDFGRGFTVQTATIKDVELKATDDGPVLAGVDEIHIEGMEVQPDGKNISVRSVEVVKPHANVLHDENGLHAFGLVLKREDSKVLTETFSTNPQPPDDIPASAPANMADDDVAVVAPAAPDGEFKIERLQISGLSSHVEDRTTTPITILPLANVDLDMRGVSNRVQFEHKPIRFSCLVGSGQVAVPKQLSSSGLVGAIGDFASLLGVGKKSPAASDMQQQDLFSQMSGSGVIYLYPTRSGWMKASISGLELYGLAGVAQRRGVKLGGGTVDGTVDLRFEDKITDVRANLVATDLQVSEPHNGLIFRYLHLPMPVDVAVKTIQDAQGSIRIPLHFQVTGVQTDNLVASVAQAVGGAIIKTIASIPQKTLATAVSFIGLGGRSSKPIPPVSLFFLPGDTALEASEQVKLDALIERMRKDKTLAITLRHDLGSQDVTVVEKRANPSREEATNMATQLHSQKIALAQQQAQWAGKARTLLASDAQKEAIEALEHLREIERRMASVEDALDHVYELSRRGAERNADRRTRQAALELGRQRMTALNSKLVDAGIPAINQRVQLANAQFNASEAVPDGKLVITIVHTKR